MYTYEYPKADNTSSIICFHHELGSESRNEFLTLLAIRRAKAPFEGMLALPGGFLDVMAKAPSGIAVHQGETLERCAQRELEEETGIVVSQDDLVLVCVQSAPLRDPRNHVIDHVYAVNVSVEKISAAKAADDASGLETLRFNRGGFVASSVKDDDWAFDHADSLRRFFANHLHWL